MWGRGGFLYLFLFYLVFGESKKFVFWYSICFITKLKSIEVSSFINLRLVSRFSILYEMKYESIIGIFIIEKYWFFLDFSVQFETWDWWSHYYIKFFNQE